MYLKTYFCEKIAEILSLESSDKQRTNRHRHSHANFPYILARLLFHSNKQHANALFLFRTLLDTEKCLAINSLTLQHKFCNLLKFSFFSIFKKLTIGNF